MSPTQRTVLAWGRLSDAGGRTWQRIPEPLRKRLLSLAILAGTGGVLGAALWLDADPTGHGTHLQLGLGRCSFLQATGQPCPMCGATTTFTLWAHLRPLEGIANQPFASLLFLMTLAAFALALVEIVRPRARWGRLFSAIGPYELPLALGFLAAMIGSWIYKIWLMS